MVVTFNTETLNGLCSKDQLDLLDAVDQLRSQGIDHIVSLPQIIVCGDQSSGKSSVLEAISGVPFPVKGNVCTRFPTELVLRRADERGIKVSIVPHKSIGDADDSNLSSFQEELDGFDGFPELVEKAKATMGVSTEGKGFSKDLLRVEITGPDRPHLTIVDLPGLVHTATKKQSSSDVELVKSVVKHYMIQPRTIILAVVSAKNDIANQIVLRLARSIDPTGNRTIGVITKPDTLRDGSETQKAFLSLAKNQEVHFKLGWHVLKNMDSEEGAVLLHQRNTEEASFFQQPVWKELPSSMLGISELRTRLSNVLLRQIAVELPSLISEIDQGLATCRKQLSDLGTPRRTTAEQRRCLLQVGQDFQALVKAAVGGLYTDVFFEPVERTKGEAQRIRAIAQNLNQDFADEIAEKGKQRVISEVASTEIGLSTKTESQPTRISRDDYIEHVLTLMRRTKGRELPGEFNSMVIEDLFLEQSAPWKDITYRYIQLVWEASQEFLGMVVTHVADVTVRENIIREVIDPAMNALLASLKSKTAELLSSHNHLHPITYNEEYITATQNVDYESRKQEYTRILTKFFSLGSLQGQQYINSKQYNVGQLLESLTEQDKPSARKSSAAVALDCMNVYYDVSKYSQIGMDLGLYSLTLNRLL